MNVGYTILRIWRLKGFTLLRGLFTKADHAILCIKFHYVNNTVLFSSYVGLKKKLQLYLGQTNSVTCQIYSSSCTSGSVSSTCKEF